MMQSVMDICREKGIDWKNTVYADCSTKMLDFKIVSGDFYELMNKAGGKSILTYKNCLEVCDFNMLKNQLSQLDKVNYPNRDDMPYFSTGLSGIADCIGRGEKVAVEGGPCLFGTNEVMIEVVRKDGRKEYFDYNTGKSYLTYEQEQSEDITDFAAYVNIHARDIKAIHFDNRKAGITPQEWSFIKYPFEIADVIDAPLVIPIPDMSYMKYLSAVLEHIDADVRKSALEEFGQVEYAISDMYLELIEQMRESYRNVHCEVVHARNSKLCEEYYEKRALYMNRNKIVRNLTGIPEKLESVKDYVSMPALPYYLWGIDNIIEVDSMDETDSFRKCRKAHKNDVNLACILFPELLSTDKIHTIFDAPWDRKEYGNYALD